MSPHKLATACLFHHITSLLLRLLLGGLLLLSAVLLLGALLLLGLILAQVLIALIRLRLRTALLFAALSLHPPLLLLLGALLGFDLGLLDLILLRLRRLKATVAVLTRRIDEAQLNLLLRR